MSEMELKKIEDAAGNTLTVLVYKGRMYPEFPKESICGIESFQARNDDVVVCAYPKSGTHWMWEMVRLLQNGTTDVPVVEKDDGMIELLGSSFLDGLPSPRALNTHVHFELLPADFFHKKCKIVYMSRNPRDVAVSYYNHHRKLEEYYHYNGKWQDYLPLFLDGKLDYESWFAYTRGWEQGIQDHPELPIHVTSYEALHADTIGELKKLAAFMGCKKSDDEFLTQVMRKCSFDTMRAAKAEISDINKKTGSPIMYRKGKTGDWKNWFTVAQSDKFNSVFEQEMQGTSAYDLYSHTRQSQCGPDDNMNQK